MDLKKIIIKVIKEAKEKKLLNEENLKIYDISNASVFPKKELKSNDYFVLHHTAGRGTAMDVVRVLNTRKCRDKVRICPLAIQYIIDREGKIYKASKGSKGAHLTAQYPGKKNIKNSTAKGVEIIANDDSDVLISQCRSALLLVKSLKYSLNQVYGHGDVSSNKRSDEGATCKAYFKKYWDTTEAQLPTIDNSLNVETPSSTSSKITPSDSAEYMSYLIDYDKIYNPTGVETGKVGELKLKGSDGKKIYGFRRISDKRVFLFKFETLEKVKYLEMNWDTFVDKKNTVVNGPWGTLTKTGKNGGVIDKEVKKPKESTNKKESSQKTNKTGEVKTIVIGGMSYATKNWMREKWVEAGLSTDGVEFINYTDDSKLQKLKNENNIKKIMGFSAGGVDAFDELLNNGSKYDFIGLIDPTIKERVYNKFVNSSGEKIKDMPSNVYSLAGWANWGGVNKPVGNRMKVMEKLKLLTSSSKGHKEIPLEFFTKYKDKLK